MNKKRNERRLIRIDVENEKHINRKTIIEILVKELKVDSKFISYISTPFSSNSWLVSFKEDYDISKIVDVNIRINDDVIPIQDYNKPKKQLKYNTYKLLWLPHGVNLAEVKEYFMNLFGSHGDIRCTKFYEEKYFDRDAPEEQKETQIKTGNIIATVSYLEDVNVKDIRDIHDYYGKRVRIVQFGDEIKCFACNELGHIKTKCPFTGHKCVKCGRLGHRDCNFANRLNSSEASAMPQHDEDHQFNNQQQGEVSSSQINTISDVQNSIEKDGNLMHENAANILGKTGKTKRAIENTSLNTTASSTTEQNNKKNKTDQLDSSKSSKSSSNNESMESDEEDENGENEKEDDEVNGNDKWENGQNGENRQNGENGQDGNNENEAKK